MYQINTLHTLNLHNVMFQLYLSKAGGKYINRQLLSPKKIKLRHKQLMQHLSLHGGGWIQILTTILNLQAQGLCTVLCPPLLYGWGLTPGPAVRPGFVFCLCRVT